MTFSIKPTRAVSDRSLRSKAGAAIASAMVVMLLGSCSSDSNFPFDQALSDFNPTDGTIPFPNGLLFAGSEDGTLNIPVADPTDFSNPQVALNALDGFSTTEPATTSFEQALAADSLVVGQTVRVFQLEADPITQAPLSVIRELDGSEILATPAGDGSTLAIVPLRPLPENSNFMIVVTNGIRDAVDGLPIGRSPWFNIVADQGDQLDPDGATGALIPLSQLTNQLLNLAGSQGVGRGSVVLTWNFKTQSTTPVLQAAKNNAVASNLVVGPTGLNTAAVGGFGAADILAGSLDVPYYLQPAANPNDPTPLTSFWTGQEGSNLTAFNPQPELVSTQTIPVLMTVPNANAGVGERPPEGWPVAIFQHGITRDRSDMLALADTMAAAGFAVISIDIPLHGITDTSSPLYSGAERTFDLDLQNGDGAPGPDGVIDGSGSYFYNLQNLLNTRDNFRQGIADLWTLSASVGNLAEINGERKAFIGFSLGAIIGSTMLAFDDSFNSATLASPGGGTARLLAASPAFGPEIIAGLEAATQMSLETPAGQAFLNTFLSATQTIVDSADPVNHAAATAASAPIHLSQILPDQVVVGAVPGAALSGTEPLARLMGLPIVNETTSGSGWVRFLGGTHGSILDPTSDAGVTMELQNQIAVFAASEGDTLQINDPALLDAP